MKAGGKQYYCAALINMRYVHTKYREGMAHFVLLLQYVARKLYKQRWANNRFLRIGRRGKVKGFAFDELVIFRYQMLCWTYFSIYHHLEEFFCDARLNLAGIIFISQPSTSKLCSHYYSMKRMSVIIPFVKSKYERSLLEDCRHRPIQLSNVIIRESVSYYVSIYH